MASAGGCGKIAAAAAAAAGRRRGVRTASPPLLPHHQGVSSSSALPSGWRRAAADASSFAERYAVLALTDAQRVNICERAYSRRNSNGGGVNCLCSPVDT